MKWLLWLYPRAWRQRYADEFLALVEQHGWSAAVLFDIVRGALDARLHPRLGPAPAAAVAAVGAAQPVVPGPFDRFTRRSRNVLRLAEQEAQRLQHASIGTEHLLLGLLLESEGVAAHVLAQVGVDVEQVRLDVESRPTQATPGTSSQAGLTQGAKRAIILGVAEANRLRHRYLGTEHLLLGIVGEPEGPAAEILRQHNVGDMDDLRQRVMRAINEGPRLSPPRPT